MRPFGPYEPQMYLAHPLLSTFGLANTLFCCSMEILLESYLSKVHSISSKNNLKLYSAHTYGYKVIFVRWLDLLLVSLCMGRISLCGFKPVSLHSYSAMHHINLISIGYNPKPASCKGSASHLFCYSHIAQICLPTWRVSRLVPGL